MTERVQPSPEPVASSLAEGKTAEWWMNKTMYWKEQFDAVVRQRDHALAILKARDAEIAALASHAPASAPSEEHGLLNTRAEELRERLMELLSTATCSEEAVDILFASSFFAALRGASPRPSDQNSNSPHSAPSNGLSTGEVSGLRQNSNAVREERALAAIRELQIDMHDWPEWKGDATMLSAGNAVLDTLYRRLVHAERPPESAPPPRTQFKDFVRARIRWLRRAHL